MFVGMTIRLPKGVPGRLTRPTITTDRWDGEVANPYRFPAIPLPTWEDIVDPAHFVKNRKANYSSMHARIPMNLLRISHFLGLFWDRFLSPYFRRVPFANFPFALASPTAWRSCI